MIYYGATHAVIRVHKSLKALTYSQMNLKATHTHTQQTYIYSVTRPTPNVYYLNSNV